MSWTYDSTNGKNCFTIVKIDLTVHLKYDISISIQSL